jgi:adenylate cyclase
LKPTNEFEAHLAREIVQSERLRMAILAALFAAVMVLMVLFTLIFRDERIPFVRSPMTLALALAVSGAMVAYELGIRRVLLGMLRRGTMPPTELRFLNAVVETSVPSFLIMLVAREIAPLAVMQGPAAYLYAVFIVLSTLRLDFTLSVFTGTVAAVEFAALSFMYSTGAETGIAAVLGSTPFILGKAVVLLFCGIVAGLVAQQLRRRMTKAFEAAQERSRIVAAFGQQVSPAVVEELLRQGPEIASRRSFVCVMFMDIRNFTPLVERRSPEEIVALQNAVFGVAIDVVNRHHGVINQFLGDGFMATFGAPLATGDDCRNAVAAARELVARIHDVKIGIGLHAGDAVSGNVGSAARKQYSITGNVVILASRIEQLNKEYDSRVLVSREVLERCGDAGQGAALLGPVHVKGREDPIEIYRIA